MATGGAEAPAVVHDALGSQGRPLDAATRAYFEPRFGEDFSGVRIHTDARAAASAAAVQARAYTVGSNIAFGADEYAPATMQGRELLAHELAHTVQQQRRVGLARKPTEDDERAKAVAEANAVVARIDQELADADKDEEPKPKAPAKPKTPSRFLPGGFTDKEANAVYQEAESRRKLLSMALVLAERQAKRHEFWDRNPSHNTAGVKEASALDLYWDPKQEGFIRQPSVSKDEAIVDADPEASRLYKDRLWDLTENKPKKKSRFKRVMDAICAHTEPCASNIEQMHRDKEAGMSDAEALNSGMARLTLFVETLALPGEGPRGPIALSEGGPSGMPYGVPASEPAVSGGASEQPIESGADPTRAGSAPVRDPTPTPDPVRPPSGEVAKDPARSTKVEGQEGIHEEQRAEPVSTKESGPSKDNEEAAKGEKGAKKRPTKADKRSKPPLSKAKLREHRFISALKERYPKLARLDIRARARPSPGAPESAFEERMQTSQGQYSLGIYNADGKLAMELDGISPDGWVQEIKIEQKIDKLDDIMAQLRRQADWAKAHGLQGVEYSISSPEPELTGAIEQRVSNEGLNKVVRPMHEPVSPE